MYHPNTGTNYKQKCCALSTVRKSSLSVELIKISLDCCYSDLLKSELLTENHCSEKIELLSK